MILVSVMYPAGPRFDMDYYLGHHMPLNKRVAVKVMHPFEDDRAIRTERFTREAQTAARLKPLIARAGAVINGYDLESSEDITTGEQQATVDALLET